jgi:hypothetical protein
MPASPAAYKGAGTYARKSPSPTPAEAGAETSAVKRIADYIEEYMDYVADYTDEPPTDLTYTHCTRNTFTPESPGGAQDARDSGAYVMLVALSIRDPGSSVADGEGFISRG